MKKAVLIIICAAILALACVCIVSFSLSDAKKIYYYTQIDNSKVKANDSRGGVIDFKGGLPYLYSLLSYSENGEVRECSFGTERKLRDGAFIRLRLMPLRGVVNWEEITYDELTEAVRAKYPEDQSSMTAPV